MAIAWNHLTFPSWKFVAEKVEIEVKKIDAEILTELKTGEAELKSVLEKVTADK
jgi:hypothetical protein